MLFLCSGSPTQYYPMNAPNIAYVFAVPRLDQVPGSNSYLISVSSTEEMKRLFDFFGKTQFMSVSRSEDGSARVLFNYASKQWELEPNVTYISRDSFPESLQECRESQRDSLVVLAVSAVETEVKYLANYTQLGGSPFKGIKSGTLVRCNLETKKGELLS